MASRVTKPPGPLALKFTKDEKIISWRRSFRMRFPKRPERVFDTLILQKENLERISHLIKVMPGLVRVSKRICDENLAARLA